MINNLLWVALGGGLGSMARYLCQRWFTMPGVNTFPWGTFVVNITGCLLIGIFWGISFRSFSVNENWKLFLMTGLCGGFTTFSAFTLEGIGMIRSDKWGLFFLYAAGSIFFGLIATFFGMKLVK